MIARSRAIVLWLARYVIAPHGERESTLSARGCGGISTRRWASARPVSARAWRADPRPRRGRAAAALCAASLGGVGLLGAGAADATGGAQRFPAATLARTVPLSESGRLRLTSKKGFTLNERGSASGTISGLIYIHLHLVSDSRVTAEVNIYPRAGSLTGSGSASYRVVGGYAAFSGTLSITRGSGKYAHARASGLRFTGTIQRRDDSVTAQLSGRLSY